MLGWLKDKLSGIKNIAAAEKLRTLLDPLDKLPAAKPRLADRLTHYVFTGDGAGVVAELAALQQTQSLTVAGYYYSSGAPETGFSKLIKVLPHDPELFLRLARVYEAAHQVGTGYAVVASTSRVPGLQGSLSWVGTFLSELSRSGNEEKQILPASLVCSMMRTNGDDPNVLIAGAFMGDDALGKCLLNSWTKPPYTYYQCLQGFAELVSGSPDTIRPAFRQKNAISRAAALRAIGVLKITLDPFSEEIAALAVSGSKEVRENAASLIADRFSLFKPLLENHAEKGNADERFHAVRLLVRLGGNEVHTFLSQRLETEKSEKIREIIQAELSEPAALEGEQVEDYDLPEVAEVAVNAPLDKDLLVELRQRIEDTERRTAEAWAANQYAQQHGWKRTPVPTKTADKVFDLLQNLVVKPGDSYELFANSQNVDQQLLSNYPVPPQFQLIHLIRWCLLLSCGRNGRVSEVDPWMFGHWRPAIMSYQKIHGSIDLRNLAAVFRSIGLDDRSIGRQLLRSNRYVFSPFLRSDADTVWPYFAERLDLIEEALGLRPAGEPNNPYQNLWDAAKRQNAFSMLQQFPRLPAKLLPMLWDLALGAGKTDRPFAQACLNQLPNKEQKIVAALASRQQDARFAAAQWLGALKYTEAIPALRQALSKEKSEVVKDELIKSLESLGVPLDELLDLEKLDKEAEQGLKKGLPKDLEWFPFSQLPAVRWSESGKPVPTAIIHWFLVQSYKLKNAEAGPTLRRYCSLFLKEDREVLGKFVLEAWIGQDTKPKYTSEQAAAEAQKMVQQVVTYAKQYPQYYPDFSEERTYQTHFNWLVIQPEGSQTSTKGILAVSGACCGGDAAPIVHRYIKQWYGHRAAQCKALLQVLAWIDDPSATQVILSVANRFRTKGIQEEAVRQCQLLAERKGWTIDELADRTIPTAGFDETGRMELDYGSRTFSAALSEEMTITVTNPVGKTIASLPDANQSDDPEKAKNAKAALSNARKELKSVLGMQKDRLYEALCTQRAWRFEDWDTYLRQHPIVGRYCQRLVWVAYEDERIVASFRPLADGSLTNHEDDEVSLQPETSIRLGHDETLPPEDRTAWLQHFADYKVEPLFQQFGKANFTLADHMKAATEIKDFLGHLVKAFSLRNRLTRLGYTRGAAQDAGWFFDYHKGFMGLGLEAVIEFSGNPLPEENRTVALQRLYFARKMDQGEMSFSEEVPLGELPRVLLAECWNDIRMAAAEGTGFAADWEKQTEY